MSVANCPSCGAMIEFAIGSSEVVVCGTCRSVVARTDRGMELHGKVAALIDTGSPIQVGTNGRYGKIGFRISGRTQMRHQAGGLWDEWYAALDDGRWVWLAEAQGRIYATVQVAAEVPPFESLGPGDRIFERLVVAEVGEAELVSAEGELPWTPEPGSRYRYADLTGPQYEFATIDYSEMPPLFFHGTETTYEGLGIQGEAARRARVAATTLNCSQCGGALDLKAPDQAERIWCPYCGSGHDITNGKLQYFAKLKKKRVAPVIPLGSSGTVDGDSYVVAGFMERAVRFDRDYFWTEYLLFNRNKGYRWLVHSDDHWSFVTPLRPGDVLDGDPRGISKNVHYDGRSYKLFQDATARVTYVSGEFYWKVAAGEEADTVDYVQPPFGISKELTRSGAREISYSHGRYMEPEEVETSFGVTGLPRPAAVGPMQPFKGAALGKTWLVLVALLVLVAIALQVTRSRARPLDSRYDLGDAVRPAGAPPSSGVLFTEAFELSGKSNVQVTADASLSNTWLHLVFDLVNESTGAMQSFELPLEYYSGNSGGESWKEGDRDRSIVLSRPPAGRYVMRIEAHWASGFPVPPPVRVRVREGVFRIPYFVLAFLGISIFPILGLLRKASWESRRWKDSAHSPFAALQTADDDEE